MEWATSRNDVLQRMEERRRQNPYFDGRHCGRCGTTCYDENAWENHACTPEAMKERSQRMADLSMAAIIICDRCGQIATAKVAGGCVYQANPDNDSERFALCPNCSRELYDFLHLPNKDVRAIMAPFDPDAERAPEGPTQAETSRSAIEAEYGEGGSTPTPQGYQTRY